MKVSGLVFDLDGTLVDSLADIAGAMNRALERLGWPTHPVPAYRRFVGEGVLRLATQAAPPGADTGALMAAYRDEYLMHIDAESRPYPGVPELLATLIERAVPMAILTNKPEEIARPLVERLLPGVPFLAVRGPGLRRKPAPEPLLELVPLLGVPRQAIAMVGDTAVDVATARAAGARSIGVSWGFRPEELAGADLVIDAPAQLLRAL